MSLTYAIGTGNYDYVACIIGPTPQTGKTKNDFKSPALRVLNLDNPLPSGGVQVNVPAGSPQLVASLRDAAGNIPPGVNVTVTTPDGTVLDQATTPYAPNLVVQTQNGYLLYLIGGEDQNENTLTLNEAYDPATNQYILKAPMPTGALACWGRDSARSDLRHGRFLFLDRPAITAGKRSL